MRVKTFTSVIITLPTGKTIEITGVEAEDLAYFESIEAAAAAEREECAKLCESDAFKYEPGYESAAAIRARGGR